MLLAILIAILGLMAQWTLVFGCSYFLYKYVLKGSALQLKIFRQNIRFWGIVGTAIVFLVLLALEIISQDISAWPFVASIWVMTILIAHDFALGLVIQKYQV